MTVLTPNQKEFKLQCAVVEHLASAFPGLEYTAFPGRPGSARDGFFKRKMGVKPGVPDLIFTWNDGHLRAGLIELKADTGRVSNDQNRVMSAWSRLGWSTNVCRTVRQVHETLQSWGITPKHNGIQEPDYRSWDEQMQQAMDLYAPHEERYLG